MWADFVETLSCYWLPRVLSRMLEVEVGVELADSVAFADLGHVVSFD